MVLVDVWLLSVCSRLFGGVSWFWCLDFALLIRVNMDFDGMIFDNLCLCSLVMFENCVCSFDDC